MDHTFFGVFFIQRRLLEWGLVVGLRTAVVGREGFDLREVGELVLDGGAVEDLRRVCLFSGVLAVLHRSAFLVF